MDEKRASFQPTLWSGVPPKSDVKQLWFPGVHSDVGGGYRESGLADAALKWMIDEASSHGLKFTSAVDQVSPNYHDMMHDSCDGVFSLLPTQPRSIPNIQEDEPSFHISAIKRRDDPPITQSPYRKGRRVSSPLPLIIDVSARVPWNETGVWLQAGVQYEFSASGEWLDGTISCGPSGTADGRFQAAEVAHLLASAAGKVESWYGRLFRNSQADFKFTKRHEDYDWFSLVGAIANSCGVDSKEGLLRPETFLIGDGCVYTPDKSGYLYVYANDAWNCYENNRGHVALSIMV
ncbi:DUF2235 domain-containing protein [Stutzerimonas zhaodongensis]|uniref:DUF2235 domain-containing protein n=1 Tax=Stutzerimonas zhaodongensis TaxID=1176257 RepID=A0A3M2HGV9_9GAMM|nr:DUF2235 domain-containing protein [Stutzerimonas zhaodongensis]RMH87665.1 DUF2235 domain-containing protein [Stutzerimonas zhaodongensis]